MTERRAKTFASRMTRAVGLKTSMSDIEKLGIRVAGSEQQAKQLVQRALAVLGFRVVHKSWGMCIEETVDGKCNVFFDGWPSFSISWSSMLGKLVASREIGLETKEEDECLAEDQPPERRKDICLKWTSNPLFGCESREEVELKLDLHNLG